MISIDRLKEMALEDIENNPEKNSEEYVELLQQLDQLKAENETYKKMLDNAEVRVALIDVKTGDRELWRNLGMKADKLKQTLIEIKEIAKKTLNMVDYKTYFKRDNKSLKQEGFKALNEILQKISEVEK